MIGFLSKYCTVCVGVENFAMISPCTYRLRLLCFALMRVLPKPVCLRLSSPRTRDVLQLHLRHYGQTANTTPAHRTSNTTAALEGKTVERPFEAPFFLHTRPHPGQTRPLLRPPIHALLHFHPAAGASLTSDTQQFPGITSVNVSPFTRASNFQKVDFKTIM